MEPHTVTKRTIKVLFPYLAILATVYTLYFAKTLFLPLIVAIFVTLFSDPLVTKLEKLRVPRSVSTLCVMGTIFTILCLVVLVFKDPAQTWAKKLPDIANEMSNSISEATQTLDEDQYVYNVKSDKEIEKAGNNIRKSTFIALAKGVASATPILLAQAFATVFMIYFFLVYGQTLLLRFIQLKPSFSDKRNVVELVSAIQKELSKYVLTIASINLGLAIAVGTVFYFVGIEDPFLWGAVAGILNFAPYIGPMISACIFALVAYIQFNQVEYAFIVPGIYLSINLVESQFITPTLLGSNLNLNPLIVFIWLLIWGWIWGAFGMLVGVPLLVCLSIYLEKTELIGQWHLMLRNTKD